MIAWQSKTSVFDRSNVAFVLAHDPTEGEVRWKVLEAFFWRYFLLLTYQINLNTKIYFNNQKQPK